MAVKKVLKQECKILKKSMRFVKGVGEMYRDQGAVGAEQMEVRGEQGWLEQV